MASSRTAITGVVGFLAYVSRAPIVEISPDGSGATATGCIGLQPLANHLRGAVRDVEAFEARIESLVDETKRTHPTTAAGSKRNFGANTTAYSGHMVTFLQAAALKPREAGGASSFVDELWDEVFARADAWGVARSVASANSSASSSPSSALTGTRGRRRLALRCLELIEYDSSESHALSYHVDGETLMTTSLMLSRSGSFEGGALKLRRVSARAGAVGGVVGGGGGGVVGGGGGGVGVGGGACVQSFVAAYGDVLAWRGWEEHMVMPVTSGRRRVLVAEWWSPHVHGDVREVDDRPDDSYEGLREAMSHDPSSPILRSLSASMLLELVRAALPSMAQMTEEEQEQLRRDVAELEDLLREALAVDPTHLDYGRTHAALGWVMMQRGRDAMGITPVRFTQQAPQTSLSCL